MTVAALKKEEKPITVKDKLSGQVQAKGASDSTQGKREK